MEFQIRPAEPSDALAIAQVHVASWQAAYRGIVPDSHLDALEPAAREAQWAATLADNAASLFVACAEGAVRGFCCSAAARDDDLGPEVGEVTAIYVAPESWASGAGRALLSTALVELARQGFSGVSLWVFEANQRARRFYEAAGFVLDGKQALIFGSLTIPEVRYRRGVPR